MPSFLCESSPTGQYTSYVAGSRVSVRVSLAPGWMTAISFSIPCPSTSKPCGMLPALVMLNVTVPAGTVVRSEEHTSELQSRLHLVCRLLLEKKKRKKRERWRVVGIDDATS